MHETARQLVNHMTVRRLNIHLVCGFELHLESHFYKPGPSCLTQPSPQDNTGPLLILKYPWVLVLLLNPRYFFYFLSLVTRPHQTCPSN